MLVLGSMYLGWVTVTEAAGIGASGALAIGPCAASSTAAPSSAR